MKCPVCLLVSKGNDFTSLSRHLLSEVESADGKHVMWLNRNLGKEKISVSDLGSRLSGLYEVEGDLTGWIVRRLI